MPIRSYYIILLFFVCACMCDARSWTKALNMLGKSCTTGATLTDQIIF